MVAGHTPAWCGRRSAPRRWRETHAPTPTSSKQTTARHERSSSSTFAKGSGSSRWRAGGRRAWLRRPCQPAGGERQAKGRTVFEIPSGVDGKSNTVRPGWSRSRRIEHLRLRFAARDRMGSEDPWTLALSFSSSSRARPRPRLDRSPANPSATPVTQVAIPRARGGAEAAPPNAKLGHLRFFFEGRHIRLCCGMACEWRIAAAFGVPPPVPVPSPMAQAQLSSMSSIMVVVGWFPCRIIFVGQMIVGNWHVAGVELFRALTSSSSLVCSSVNLVQIKARGKTLRHKLLLIPWPWQEVEDKKHWMLKVQTECYADSAYEFRL